MMLVQHTQNLKTRLRDYRRENEKRRVELAAVRKKNWAENKKQWADLKAHFLATTLPFFLRAIGKSILGLLLLPLLPFVLLLFFTGYWTGMGGLDGILRRAADNPIAAIIVLAIALPAVKITAVWLGAYVLLAMKALGL